MGQSFCDFSWNRFEGAVYACRGNLMTTHQTHLRIWWLSSSDAQICHDFAVMLMASVGLPLTIGFVGEFLSLLGFLKFHHF